jgi:uncharacterized protein DUF4056
MRWTAIVLLLVIMAASGCADGPAPRMRFGFYPTASLGTNWPNPKALGKHGYGWNPSEKNGMVYTCQGGDIDIAHLRISADWTRYLTKKTYRCLMESKKTFSYKLRVDRSRNYVTLTYPENWEVLWKKERAVIAEEVAAELGPHLAFTMTTWHEVLTWFGFKCIGIGTEFPSAFSWEDSYSNLLGVILGTRALRDTEHSFNEAMTILINEELDKLGAQPAKIGHDASKRVKGDWFTGSALFFVDIRERNFDIGLDDGMVTPTLVPGVDQCEGIEPISYPVPSLEALAKHGFSFKIEIEPREWESGAILALVSEEGKRRRKRIDPAAHMAPIMEYVRQDAVKRYGDREGFRTGVAAAD